MVMVETASGRSTPIPDEVREKLLKIAGVASP
jgi:acyl-CoA thioesterase FadM